jgi:hypothetical protein
MRAGKQNAPNNAGGQWFGYKGWNFLEGSMSAWTIMAKQVSDEVRNKYIGEARLMRGWFYADKVSKFGDVQWVDTELNIDDEDILYGERDDRDFVMGKVLEDMNFATANGPDDWGDGNAPGRINRWGALLVKSRICLFEGTWQKYHGGTGADMWLTEAANAAKELMDNGPYSLYQGAPGREYNELHSLTDVSGNPEVMYWRRYEPGIFTNHVQSYHRSYNGGATKEHGRRLPLYRWSTNFTSPLYQGDEVYEDIFENRDPRLRQTILHPDDQAIYNYGNHAPDRYTYPRIQGMSGGQSSTLVITSSKFLNLAQHIASYNSHLRLRSL